MASSASLGNQASTSASQAQEFYTSFGRRIQSLNESIANSSNLEELNLVVAQLSSARNDLTDATAVLPAHDRQTYEQNLKNVSEALESRRKALQPKSAFTFRRKTRAPDGTAVASSSTSTPSAPSPSPSPSPSAVEKTGPSASVSGSGGDVPKPDVSQTAYSLLANRSDGHLTLSDLASHGQRKEAESESESPQASDLHLRSLESCIIDLRVPSGSGHTSRFSALQLRGLRRSVVLVGEVDGSIMVHDCEDCLIVVSCRQFRMHLSTRISVLIRASSTPTIEHCNSIHFGSVPASLLQHAPTSLDLARSRTEQEASQRDPVQVQDFDHIRLDVPSPNWSVLRTDERERLFESISEVVQLADGGSEQAGWTQERVRAQVARVLGAESESAVVAS